MQPIVDNKLHIIYQKSETPISQQQKKNKKTQITQTFINHFFFPSFFLNNLDCRRRDLSGIELKQQIHFTRFVL